jgi:hypothetical protein
MSNAFDPAEFIRDLNDARFAAALPRVLHEPDHSYARRLAAGGHAVVLSRTEMVSGGFLRAKTEAANRGLPLLVPYDVGERPLNQAFGPAPGKTANQHFAELKRREKS